MQNLFAIIILDEIRVHCIGRSACSEAIVCRALGTQMVHDHTQCGRDGAQRSSYRSTMESASGSCVGQAKDAFGSVVTLPLPVH